MPEERSDSENSYMLSDRWPKVGDRLFSPARDVHLAEGGDERNYRLLRGYKKAGDVLVETALGDPIERQNLIFPALFNYRHYVELALKSMIDDYGAYFGILLDKRNHKLVELWAMFLLISVKFGIESSDIAILAVGDCIGEIDRIDAGSVAFRYARSLKGDVLNLPRNGIDLVQLRDVMDGIENFFEALDACFYARTMSDESA